MLITLISAQKYFSLHLPEKVSGKYWIKDDDRPLGKDRILSIEADEEKKNWVIYADKYVRLFDNKDVGLSEIRLVEGKLYPIHIGREQIQAYLFVESFTEDRCTYKKYKVTDNGVFAIGRSAENQIVINNPYVSREQAMLSYQNGVWVLLCRDGTNGTYVNRSCIEGQMQLHMGDTIFIMGCKIVIGSDFFSINNPDDEVTIKSDNIVAYVRHDDIDDEKIIPEERPYYYRSPRFRADLVPLEMNVEMPPRADTMDETPLIVTMLPALLMGVASFSTGLISVINVSKNGGNYFSVLPTMLMAVSMLVGMVLFPFIMRKRERRRKKERETERRNKYIAYLGKLRDEVSRNISAQTQILISDKPPILDKAGNAEFWEHKLWENTTDQEDFLYLRLGIGNMELVGNIKFPEEKFTIDDDVLLKELQKFQNESHKLLNVPVGVSLMEERVLGIVGDRELVLNEVNNVLLQILLLHSYDEVKVICLCEAKDAERLSYLRYAQHLWDDSGKERYLAVTEDNLRELSIRVGHIIRERKDGQSKNPVPEYILLSTSKVLANKCSFLEDILREAENLNFSVICAYEEIKDLPKECHAVAELVGGQGQIIDRGINQKRTIFVPDQVSTEQAEGMIREMAGKSLDLNRGRYDLPDMLPFLDMFGVGKYEHLNILQRWKENNPVKSLRAPIGVDTNGETFYLDLHQDFHGPHGLVAGMTGSGKSEFIISYVLSMAVNFHPDEVAFVLIDYKGGGLTGAFENEEYRLPHLAGTITNLDGAAIMRSILSIKSELIRRQKIFNSAREIANEGTMDIYKYQKMYRDGLVTEAVPHLIIISDEFAELKSQQPEFLDQLISTARIGRSLGVHLILATQKPAGVVNDQIWANSKFKVCLKVQDRADSMDMLKRPDAASIAETGRFYLQVGYDELFEKGQSAWSGAPYYEEDCKVMEPDGSIEVYDELGNTIDRIRGKKTDGTQEKGKQLVRIVRYLVEIAQEENISVQSLWKPALRDDLTIDEIIEKYGNDRNDRDSLYAVIGEYDDPYHQDQHLMEIDFTKNGNLLLYGTASSGYEKVIYAVLYSLYQRFAPEELNIYLLDFGSETLRMFENMPQTSSVILDADDDKQDQFYRIISEEIKDRKKKLANYGGELSSYNASEEKRLPYILIVINNFAHFIEVNEKYEDKVVSMTREGNKYGIYFMISSMTVNAVRYRIGQNFAQTLMMQMNSNDDYLSVIGRTGGVYPEKKKGSGIFKTDETYLFQMAKMFPDDTDLWGKVQKLGDEITVKYSGRRASRIKTIPEFIDGLSLQHLSGDLRRLPVGYGYSTRDYIMADLESINVLPVLGYNAEMTQRYAAGIAEMMQCRENTHIVAFNIMDKVKQYYPEGCEMIDKDRFAQRVHELFETAVERDNAYQPQEGKYLTDEPTIFIIFAGLASCRKLLDAAGLDELGAMLKCTQGFCRMFFMVCDDDSGFTAYRLDDWVRNKAVKHGIWIGNGVEKQYSLPVNIKRNVSERTDIRDGYWIADDNNSKMRLILPIAMKSEV